MMRLPVGVLASSTSNLSYMTRSNVRLHSSSTLPIFLDSKPITNIMGELSLLTLLNIEEKLCPGATKWFSLRSNYEIPFGI